MKIRLKRILSLLLVGIMLFNLCPNVVVADDTLTISPVDTEGLKYFKANFFNYDARKFDFATRALQLYNIITTSEPSELVELFDHISDEDTAEALIASIDDVNDAAALLENADSIAAAGDYLVASTKNTLLFNFSAVDEHYNQFYDDWFASINSNDRTWLDIHKPYLPQNNWTNQLISPGIVGEKGAELEDELPDFAYTQAGLFIPSSNDSDRTLVEFDDEEEEWIIDESLNLKFPFKKTEEGYCEFDSESMYIENVLEKDDGDTIALFEDAEAAPHVGGKRNGFWPFAEGHNFEQYLDGGQSSSHTDKSEDFLSDQYHFGMNLEAKFVVPEGRVVEDNPMIFEFTGDDDLWVYIDGRLALDVGGCHKALGGRIDFTTGDITYFDPSYTGEDEYYPVLDVADEDDWNAVDAGNKLFRENASNATHESPVIALKDPDDDVWNLYSSVGLDEDAFYPGSIHSIEIFYLERGTGESNCKMKFNIPTIDKVEAEKEAYVYDKEDNERIIEDGDTVYTGETVHYSLSLTNKSWIDLEDVVMYDKELGILFDKNGIKKDVDLDEVADLDSYDPDEYDYYWEDDDESEIKEQLSKLIYNSTVTISEDGVIVDDETYGTENDKKAIKEVLTSKMTKDIIRNEDDVSNTLYAIGRCDEDIFDVPYIGDDVTIEYKIRDTELWVRQIVVEEIDGKDVLVENPKDAMIDITGELEDENKDIRNLYFTSNEDYEKYTSYYHEVEYVAMPVVPSDYELVKMDIRDEEMKNPMNLDSYNIDGSSGTFEYEYSDENDDISYVKYLTVYMRKKSNNNWHNDDAILNEFNPIEINL